MASSEDFTTKLPFDLLEDIAARADGDTLGIATCACSTLRSLADNQSLWKGYCQTLWPSISTLAPHMLASLGGHRNLYSMCRPLLVFDDHTSNDRYPYGPSLVPPSPSDFMLCVDMHYKGARVFSKLVTEMPGGEYYNGWFAIDTFRVKLVKLVNGLDETKITVGECPDGYLTALMAGVRLSYIAVDKRVPIAVNLSSQVAIGGSVDDKGEVVLSFGSVLPVRDVDSCTGETVMCWLRARFGTSGPGHFKLTELSLQIEDATGKFVNGETGLLILEGAMRSQRSVLGDRFRESCGQFLDARVKFEAKELNKKIVLQTLFVLLFFVLISYFLLCEN